MSRSTCKIVILIHVKVGDRRCTSLVSRAIDRATDHARASEEGAWYADSLHSACISTNVDGEPVTHPELQHGGEVA